MDTTIKPPVDITKTQPVPTFGSTFYDPKTGQAAGTNKYDPNTGQALTDPNASTASTTNNTATLPTDTSEITPLQNTIDTTSKDINTTNQEYDDAATQVHNTLMGFQNGSIPLTPGEQAQVAGLQQHFGQFIDQQKLTNIGASGMANIRGYQTGAAEYDPTFQAKTIGSIVTAGLNKVADLNIKMASAVAGLTQSFKENDMNAVLKTWNQYQEVSKNRTEALQKTVDQAQKAMDEAKKEQAIATRDTNIAKLFDQGITSASAIMEKLNSEGGSYSIKDVDEALKIINPSADLAGLSADYRTFLALKKAGDSSVKNMNWLQYQKAVTNATSKVTPPIPGTVSPITQSIIANPSLFDDLTPTVRGQVVSELQAAGYNTTNLGVKSLSDTAIQTVAQTQSALSNLHDLRQKILDNVDKIGPITGLAAINPYSEARKVQADIDRVKQVVGKALEGGVLRKEDEEKYKKILATITDTPETAVYKIDALIASIQRDIETYKSLQSSAGRSIDINAPLIKNGTEVPIQDLRTKYGY